MPIYEYKCEKCDQVVEILQKASDEPLKFHSNSSECGGKLHKILSHNAFHLKGGGWFKDGYSSSSLNKSSSAVAAGSEKQKTSDLPPCAGGSGSCNCG